jgi:hypothetical protein
MVALRIDHENRNALQVGKRTRRRRAAAAGEADGGAVISIYRPEGLDGDLLPFVRRDMLPERQRYEDTGCELARSCLRCPLPRCQYDDANSVRNWLIEARDREIALLRRRYRAPVDALALAYGVSPRSIFRIVRERTASTGRRHTTAHRQQPASHRELGSPTTHD